MSSPKPLPASGTRQTPAADTEWPDAGWRTAQIGTQTQQPSPDAWPSAAVPLGPPTAPAGSRQPYGPSPGFFRQRRVISSIAAPPTSSQNQTKTELTFTLCRTFSACHNLRTNAVARQEQYITGHIQFLVNQFPVLNNQVCAGILHKREWYPHLPGSRRCRPDRSAGNDDGNRPSN